MKQRKMIFLTILSTVVFLMLPNIPAIDYNMVKDHNINLITESMQIKLSNKDKVLQLINNLNRLSQKDNLFTVLETMQSQIISEKKLSAAFGSILNVILSIIVFVLNALITILSLISGLLNTIIGIIINLIFTIIKKIFHLGTILSGVLDLIASVITGLIGIFLNIIIIILGVIKDIITDIITATNI